LKIYIINE